MINEQIRQDLADLGDRFEVVLFGSRVSGGARPNSDYDIAIITRNRNKEENIQIQLDILKYYRREYDLRVFELLPIHIQMSIISNYEVIFGDPLEISEYFYQYRKIWRDCKNRIIQI
ncbi:MAG: nucleotidyltransferase domain-containing protein [Promethearchaeota archaeon]